MRQNGKGECRFERCRQSSIINYILDDGNCKLTGETTAL